LGTTDDYGGLNSNHLAVLVLKGIMSGLEARVEAIILQSHGEGCAVLIQERTLHIVVHGYGTCMRCHLRIKSQPFCRLNKPLPAMHPHKLPGTARPIRGLAENIMGMPSAQGIFPPNFSTESEIQSQQSR
jgi:hypothetical protein